MTQEETTSASCRLSIVGYGSLRTNISPRASFMHGCRWDRDTGIQSVPPVQTNTISGGLKHGIGQGHWYDDTITACSACSTLLFALLILLALVTLLFHQLCLPCCHACSAALPDLLDAPSFCLLCSLCLLYSPLIPSLNLLTFWYLPCSLCSSC